MKTIKINQTQLDLLIENLKSEEVVSFPTDTVYGLGCIATESAIKKMKWVKGRDEKKPFPMMVYDIKQIDEIAYITDVARKVIDHFMPGALTIVLKKKPVISEEITNGESTIAIRIPDDEILISILKKTKKLMVTSANLSGCPAGHTSEEVLEQLDGRISTILLGRSQNELASTIVDCTGSDVKILREGPITKEMLEDKTKSMIILK